MSWLITGAEKNPVDLYRSNVSLLLHGNGTNGSAVITDNSPSPKTVTAFGNAQISTAQSKFGGASIAFDGTGDYLSIPTTTAFEYKNADFTIEMWLYRSGGGQQHLYEGRRVSTTNRLLLYLNPSNQLTLYSNGFNVISSTSVPTLNAWAHVAVARASGITKMFLDGIQAGSSYTDNTFYAAPTDFLYVGANDAGSGSFLNGYIDDLRITNGAARYTANFTPPTAPFPDI